MSLLAQNGSFQDGILAVADRELLLSGEKAYDFDTHHP